MTCLAEHSQPTRIGLLGGTLDWRSAFLMDQNYSKRTNIVNTRTGHRQGDTFQLEGGMRTWPVKVTKKTSEIPFILPSNLGIAVEKLDF